MYRGTEFYKKLTPYLAAAYAEGFCEGEGASEEEQLAAFQYIYDKKLYLTLQGWYGRTCKHLLEAGLIQERRRTVWDKNIE
jgi:hypothetical protein